ncbi:MAG: VanZ family protein [Chthoniobacterales bacterium]
MKSFLKYWLPLIAWLAIMFVGSTDLMSAEQTSRIIGPLLRWFKPDISMEAITRIQFFVRKGAHVTEYAILAALLWRACRGNDRWRTTSILFLIAWTACAVFAVSDEFHQSFLASRTGSRGDVMIDIVGAFVGLTMCWIFARRRMRVPADRRSRI